MSLSGIILHHYPQSPVAEKVRCVLGIKKARWNSVEIPRLPPKPLLMPLTGGYRRTPVMQVGAEIWCDSQCIIRELERRLPTPTLFPHADVLSFGLGRWSDEVAFRTAIAVVLGHQADSLPAEFATDRIRLYFGPDATLRSLAGALPHHLAQMRAQLSWMNDQLGQRKAYMLGPAPGLVDALIHHLVWFIQGRYAGSRELLSRFPELVDWERRMQELGHGTSTVMDAGEALRIARSLHPEPARGVDSADPQGLRDGQPARVRPDGDGGDPWVEGELVSAGIHEICLLREDPQVGQVAVHFPRVGYRIEQ